MNIYQLPEISNEAIFEDAIADLFNFLDNTKAYKKFGRKGNKQKGIDIFSSPQRTAIQCKKKDLTRPNNVLKNELKKDIEGDVVKIIKESPGIDFDILYIISTYKDTPYLDEICTDIKHKYNTPFDIIYWGWDTLTHNFFKFPDLLKKYWPHFSYESQSSEQQFKRNLNLKKRIEKDFAPWLDYSLENRERNSSVLLRAFDGKQYPHTNLVDENGEYSWFRAEIRALFHEGVEFVTGIKDIYIDKNGRTSLIPQLGHIPVKTAEVSQVLFSDIVDYDIKGDEHFMYPHIFCKFLYKGSPFASVYYYELDNPYNTFELSR